MEMGFRAPPCAVTGQQRRAVDWMAESGGSERSDRVGETALRRVGGYRCRQQGAYCTPRIHAGRGVAPTDDWSWSWAARWVGRSTCLAGWSRVNAPSDRLGWDSDVQDRAPRTPAELEVRRVYEPSRLAAVYVSAAYAQVLPGRRRPARSPVASELEKFSGVVDDRHQLVDGVAPRAS
jgi:hypothetical protein